MRTLLKGGRVVNVFTGELECTNVLIEDDRIIGVGDYDKADVTEDVSGKVICPGFIDGHIHIESTMLTPTELAKVVLPHGTTSIVADPHEITNVCGTAGIRFMLEASRNIPLNVYIMLPSCVPAGPFDESGAELESEDLESYYINDRVLGLAEMMNYPGVIAGDEGVIKKIEDAKSNNKMIDGHAPLLSGRDLDKYISAGISTDHECTTFSEAVERIRKGQWVMIREGSAAHNLSDMLGLFEQPWAKRCLFVTDDKQAGDLILDGHIDAIIRKALSSGKDPIVAIQMATIQAATCFGLKYVGAIAPGYKADIVVLNDLESVDVCDVYADGKKVSEGKKVCQINEPKVKDQILKSVYNSFYVDFLTKDDFYIEEKGKICRVIKTKPSQLLTEEWITEIDFTKNNGVDVEQGILKIAVIERHMNTGHKCVGFISGIEIKSGAIASSVSHDSHNIIVIGTNDTDMAIAVNRVIALGGGNVAVDKEKVLAELHLPLAGLMSEYTAVQLAEISSVWDDVITLLGGSKEKSPFMTMAFMSLPVIPDLKITTRGLVDVKKQKIVSLFV